MRGPVVLMAAGRITAQIPEWMSMIDFAAMSFTARDLIQLVGVAGSVAGAVWFLARRIGHIDKRLALMEARQATYQAEVAALQESQREASSYQAEVLREVFALRERTTRLEVKWAAEAGKTTPYHPLPAMPHEGKKK